MTTRSPPPRDLTLFIFSRRSRPTSPFPRQADQTRRAIQSKRSAHQLRRLRCQPNATVQRLRLRAVNRVLTYDIVPTNYGPPTPHLPTISESLPPFPPSIHQPFMLSSLSSFPSSSPLPSPASSSPLYVYRVTSHQASANSLR